MLLANAVTSWKLSQNAHARRSYQDQHAAGLMTLEELAARFEKREHTRKVLEAELASLERTQQKAEELKVDRDAALMGAVRAQCGAKPNSRCFAVLDG
jgi:ABC-type transport system involved in cytochrome bd biosynthesis fused ATPase/permease subunit